MIAEIENIFPQTTLKHIDIKQNDTWIGINLHKVNDKTNLIILEKFLNNENIINLIDYLHKNQSIPFNCIKIVCITCTHKILETISTKYTNLNIYTAKIINN
uniref:Uncharacterized protein n=1 Tax=Pterothamnion crispum TaxID=1550583 RepID=A0A4D6WY20_9FLOR|nr:hypothetical protein [Pterothamnion crispum]